ncbi:MAG TPA: glycosyltransferase family 4 protein [Verrucomicrobiae bacterium]|jgi:glycosyltransferase involved in cell wall biosynthesis
MKIVLLSTDDREQKKRYDLEKPIVPTPQEALLQGLVRFPDIEVHVVSCLQSSVTSPQKLADNIWFHGLFVPKIGWLRTGYQGCIRAVRKKLREIQPDIVHGQGTERDCSLSAIFSGYPNVLTLHGNMRSIARVNEARPFSFLWLAARLEQFTLPRTNGVVAISRYTQSAVEGLTPRTWLLPNAVDQNFFAVQATPAQNEPPVGLCIGTVCHHKNQNNFIRALAPLASERKFKIIFLGKAEPDAYGAEFFDLIKKYPWCEYAGFANRENLKNYFQKASFLTLPTLEDNCPMVVLEAMAAGVPVIASNIGGVPDLIQPEATGLLCDPQHPESFATSVRRLLDDAALSSRLAAAAKAHARNHFHPEVIARQHVEIYREVLK